MDVKAIAYSVILWAVDARVGGLVAGPWIELGPKLPDRFTTTSRVPHTRAFEPALDVIRSHIREMLGLAAP